MRSILLIIYCSLMLNAGIFNTQNEKPKSVIDKFRKTVSDANSIIKKGAIQKYPVYTKETNLILNNIENLNLSQNDRVSLEKNIKQYSQLINLVYSNMKNNVPNIDKNYQDSLKGLITFNNSLESTGYTPLLNEWHELSKIKYKYIRKPSAKLKKRFDQKFRSVKLILEDLCLDEELEDPLLNYLSTYNIYFEELNLVYSGVDYSTIHKIKPLSYKIKSKLEFANSSL